MKITFLGTSSMIPTKQRNAFSILVSHENENILVDCGEGTQRQLRMINFSPPKITKILLTHWHGDHILGLPGLIQTLATSNYAKTLEIYGPKGTKKFFELIMKMFVNKEKINIAVTEIEKNGVFYKNDLISIEAIYLEHTTHCIAYSIIENSKRKIDLRYVSKYGLTKHPLLGKLQKGEDIVYNNKKILADKATFVINGKKITIITDTRLCNACYEIAKDSDLLISEATFRKDLKEKASEYMHLTSEQAALIAKKSKSKKLVITHISQRYKEDESKDIESEAKKTFKNTIVAKDLMSLSL
jgi:ribonuclease Z